MCVGALFSLLLIVVAAAAVMCSLSLFRKLWAGCWVGGLVGCQSVLRSLLSRLLLLVGVLYRGSSRAPGFAQPLLLLCCVFDSRLLFICVCVLNTCYCT